MKKIILLDDELESQMRIYLALCDRYKVEIAEDDRAAVTMVRKLRPDVLLMDVQPPSKRNNGRSGFKLIEKLKQKYESLKIVTILDQRDYELERELKAKGADGFVVRPIRTRALLSQMKALEL
jgi:CheY-like chemotaxis protein